MKATEKQVMQTLADCAKESIRKSEKIERMPKLLVRVRELAKTKPIDVLNYEDEDVVKLLGDIDREFSPLGDY